MAKKRPPKINESAIKQMKYNPGIYHRKSIRLKGYDYSQNGVYFITICVQNRECLLGTVENGKMILNDAGKMITTWWQKLFEKFSNIVTDEYTIMPNHIHGIIQIVGAIPRNRPDSNIRGENVVSPLRIQNSYNGLGQYISWFKRMSTNEYIRNVKQKNWKSFDGRLWQKNYYEHIIRNEQSLREIREYIINNPTNWQKDELYYEL